MELTEFMEKHGALPEQISMENCLRELLDGMEQGLAGQGNIPMLASYLTIQSQLQPGLSCCVVDAGGTNLRTARAKHTGAGAWELEKMTVCPMPGTEGELDYAGFYKAMAAPVRALGACERVGLCFSFNVTLERNLDGKLDGWCKEIRAPEAVGKPVGASLQAALGADCHSVRVLNDSVAAMLGAGDVQVGVILGTGINVCYLERCSNISKIPSDLKSDTMIISTEIGEFDGVPESDFERAVIAASDMPQSAHGEKQCSGGYLGDVIGEVWRTAAEEGLLPETFRESQPTLAGVSRFLAEEPGAGIPENKDAAALAKICITRAAKIAALLCAGPILKAWDGEKTLPVAVEGSQYWKLTGFREAFHRFLDELLEPRGIRYEIVKSENTCLIGAAMAAFAEPM